MSICIYHGNCADGFGAAWVVRKALGDIEFVGAKYQEAPPDVTGKDVVMVDFSYKRPVLLEMAEKANSILILDHHNTLGLWRCVRYAWLSYVASERPDRH